MLKNHQVTFPVTMWLFLKSIFRSQEFFLPVCLFVLFFSLFTYQRQPIGPQALIRFLKVSRAVSSQELLPTS